MTTFSKLPLSGSTNGRPVKVVQTATAGTTIHAAGSGTDNLDEIWLWCVNSDSATRKLTIEFGGTTSPDDTIEMGVPSESGLYLVVPGLVLNNSCVVKAFASVANVLVIAGYVNRIAP